MQNFYWFDPFDPSYLLGTLGFDRFDRKIKIINDKFIIIIVNVDRRGMRRFFIFYPLCYFFLIQKNLTGSR
jgi:hypothetical protein